jgi:diguanylate cyclase
VSESKNSNGSQILDLLAEACAGDPAAAGFKMHYQPIVRFQDNEVVAVEALIRWWHPTTGRIDPHVLVTLAQRAGVMHVVDNFVLHRACADLPALRDAFGRAVELHVNISAGRLGERELESAVADALQRYRLPTGRLVLEVTHTSRIASLAAAAAAAQRLRQLGVRMALDDFGSGFDALLQLHALPLDFVKLDATLAHVGFDLPRGEALCRSVSAICKGLGATVIAEGIETRLQAEALAQLGCRLGQGNLYGMSLRLPRSMRGAHRRPVQPRL